MATRLQRALHELFQALQGRPAVVVWDPTHREAMRTGLSTAVPNNQAGYVTVGLLEEAMRAVQQRIDQECTDGPVRGIGPQEDDDDRGDDPEEQDQGSR